MQQSDVDRTLSLLYKGSDLTLKSITTLSDIISAILNQLDHDKSAKFLNNYVNKGGSCEFIECNKALERKIDTKAQARRYTVCDNRIRFYGRKENYCLSRL